MGKRSLVPPPGHAIAAAVVLAVLALAAAGSDPARGAEPAPGFTHAEARDWINSPPLELARLRGRVVLVDFWTFECWNCYRSFPWLRGLERRFAGEPFTVVGVHSPEFSHERDRARVAEKVEEFGLEHPVMIDNDFSYWKAMRNRYWPTFYVIDKRGRLRGHFIGEIHAGDANARAIESLVERLLAEDAG